MSTVYVSSPPQSFPSGNTDQAGVFVTGQGQGGSGVACTVVSSPQIFTVLAQETTGTATAAG